MFELAIEKLAEIERQVAATSISAVEAGQTREKALIQAVMAMASHFDVKLKPIYAIDSRGELFISAVNPTDDLSCGPFNGFASWLNQAAPRTGLNVCTLTETSGWCYIHHFGAEKMVRAYAASLK